MNKKIVFSLLASVLIAQGGLLYSAAPQRVGIKPHEIQLAKDAAQKHGDSFLYDLLGGKEQISRKTPYSGWDKEYPDDEKNNILWPVLVWAIEEGNEDLTMKLIGIIGVNTTKPYGRPATPLEIASYHNQKQILGRIAQWQRWLNESETGLIISPVCSMGPSPVSGPSSGEKPEKQQQFDAKFTQLVIGSTKFNASIGRFPTENNRIAEIAEDDINKQKRIVEHAANVRPIIDEKAYRFIDTFLGYKRELGSALEQKFYDSMTKEAFITRLLTNRPLVFMTESDSYLLRGPAHKGVSGNGGFESIGTDHEKAPLQLKDYLSYDEMQIAALLGVSVPTYFINDGNRANRAAKAPKGSYQEEGVYVGLVGARFERPNIMEYAHMLITPDQNTTENGYGKDADLDNNPKAVLLQLWANFYGLKEYYFPTFDEVNNKNDARYLKINNHTYLNIPVYKERLRLVLEPFLVNANDIAKQQGKKAYCHAVGLGLGVWQVTEAQAEYMIDVYEEIISRRNLDAISDIDFSWFPEDSQRALKSKNNINIRFSKRNPAAKLTGNDAGKLLVAMYAWDGNSYPGNEYWQGMLAASGDPAAACCSTIPELQNPLINKDFVNRTSVIGK